MQVIKRVYLKEVIHGSRRMMMTYSCLVTGWGVIAFGDLCESWGLIYLSKVAFE
ncbi:hypothetical protein ACWPKS_01550 [Coraliomargarita sp. W4R72]